MRENIATLYNVPLSDFCTYHTGGKARTLKIVYDVDGLMSCAIGDYAIVGCGSKLLVSDDGYDGTVILMRISGVKLTEDGVYAYAGVPLPALTRFLEVHKLGGMEWASGIPGSLGGAIKLNAGAFGRSMSDVADKIDVLREGKLVTLSAADVVFSYRHSEINDIVVGASLKLFNADYDLAEKRKEYFNARRQVQPRGFSCGSVFKNGEQPAGRLIEQAGLKGLKFGGAVISEKHANFIINTGFATSKDVYTLIRTAKAEVMSKFGIGLKEEVIYLGDFH